MFVRQKPKRSFGKVDCTTVIDKEAQKNNLLRGQGKPGSVIIAVGGGKGGVGKSFFSSNLAIFLANIGYKTLLVDMDLGAPNLHTYLGEEHPKRTYHDYLRGKVKTLEEAQVNTQFPRLKLLSGGNDHSELANISTMDQSRLMSALYSTPSDFTVLDLSAGTHTSTLDFFLMAERHLVVMTPEPTSIENAYRFMKAAYFRKIKRYELQFGLRDLIADLMKNSEEHNIRFPSDLMREIIKIEPVQGNQLKHMLQSLDFNLVLNQVRGSKEAVLGESIESVCRRYFGLNTQFLGYLDYDNAAWHCLRKKKPLVLEYPQSPLYTQLLSIARDLASPHIKKAVV
jgi:flagellar biosynthesis protein FlhG